MADTYDLISLAEATAALGLPGSNSARDARVAMLITSVSRRLDKACGAIVQRSASVTEYHDGGASEIFLDHPASAFTSVTEYQSTTGTTLTRETVGTAPDEGYFAEPMLTNRALFSGLLRRRRAGTDAQFYWGRGNIAVVYTAGRYSTTATVDAKFKEASVLFLKSLWRSEEPTTSELGEFTVPGQNFPSFAVPKVVRELLMDEWREIPGVA